VHRAGIVHRDLKPDNIILIDEGGHPEPRIVDFGVSRAMRPSEGVRSAFTTREGLLVGTPEYMAPEQARGLADVDERVDIYAVGVILYEALTGRLPYEAPVMAELIVAIVRGGAPSVRELAPNVPRSISEVIDKAMALAPDGRYSTAGTMAAELLQAIGRHDSAVAHARDATRAGAARKGTLAQYGSQPDEQEVTASMVVTGEKSAGMVHGDGAGARAPTLAGSPVDVSGGAARAPTVRADVASKAAPAPTKERARPELASLQSQVEAANEASAQAPVLMTAEVGVANGITPHRVGIAHVAERRSSGSGWGRLFVFAIIVAALAGAAHFTPIGRNLMHAARIQIARVAPSLAEDLNLSSTVTIRLLGVPDNATIRLDGERIGSDVIELPRGEALHLVEVSAPRRETWSKSFDASSSASFLVALTER
jgi:hypothetical protein